MNTREMIEFLPSLKSAYFDWNVKYGKEIKSTKIKMNEHIIDEIIDLLKHGEKYKKLCEALVERYGYAYVHKLVDKSAEEVSQVREIMAKLRAEFFGSSSRPETRKEKINAIMTKMRDLGVAKNDIITLLVELRDEEEDV